MKYIEKYNRYIDDDLVIYRWDKKLDKLIQVKPSVRKNGYHFISYAPKKTVYIHRLVYEAFIREIPDGYEIDHINTIRDDNRLENLRLVTHKENYNNELTKKHISEAHKGISSSFKGLHHSKESKRKMSLAHKGKTKSEFGEKFKEHYGLAKYENPNLYDKERQWYRKHNKKCRWEE